MFDHMSDRNALDINAFTLRAVIAYVNTLRTDEATQANNTTGGIELTSTHFFNWSITDVTKEMQRFVPKCVDSPQRITSTGIRRILNRMRVYADNLSRDTDGTLYSMEYASGVNSVADYIENHFIRVGTPLDPLLAKIRMKKSVLLAAANARRTSYDKRPEGVHEPRWDVSKDGERVVSLSRESIELLSLASASHSCNDSDYTLYYSYGSGIGTNIVAKCNGCGKRFDITDYGNW